MLLALPSSAQDRTPLLDEVFQRHVVLQRDKPIPVWGEAAPDAVVTIELAGTSTKATADAAGRWTAKLPPLPAGGPHVLQARIAEGAEETVEDVLIGDVFLCSGQSNMEWPVSQTPNADAEIAASANERIRMLSVALAASPAPLDTLPNEVVWEQASPQTVGRWSAVCYYFARELQKSVDVPIGLIDASWGGSDIRAWMNADALASVGGYEDELDMLRIYATDPMRAQQALGAAWEAWWRERSGDAEESEPWQPESGADWPLAPDQLADWKLWGDPDLENHNGMVWHRATFELSETQAQGDAVLALGGIDEVDQTWINGHVLGNTFGWGTERRYTVPAELLRAGENVVVTNILNTWGQGGLTGDAPRVLLPAGTDVGVPLGNWRYKKVPPSVGSPPRAPWESVGGRTTIHNAMVAPLEHFSLRGALWYQGESNTGGGDSYLALMEALMAQWRAQFGEDVSVLIVQLANFGSTPDEPVESGWAEVREAQRRAAERDANAALAVTIDIGDPDDIHPRNKQEVGRRLAQAARSVIYGEAVPPSGPAVSCATRSGGAVRVDLKDVQGTLTDGDGGTLTGFELCGAERGSCRRAAAELSGDEVLLTGEGVPQATRVRYCWADSPVCTLHDASGLPLGPFEVDIEAAD